MQAITIGLDIAKSVFQIHGEDAEGRVVAQKRLGRRAMVGYFATLPRSLVALEACGTAHYWGRTLRELGHEVRLIPAAYVKPFVKRNKTDARDAAAICVAARRPDMRPVTIKSEAQQALRALERGRDLLVKQRTQLMNSVRAMLAEFGVVAAQGHRGFAELAARLESGEGLPEALVAVLRVMRAQLDTLTAAIATLDGRIKAAAKADATMRRLSSIPGVGPLTAHAIVAAVGDGRQFGSARDFAAWAGMTPREASSAGKRKTAGLSRQGDSRLRKLFALGAVTLMRTARARPEKGTAWQRGILARRPMKVSVMAQAAKTARIAWAVLVSGKDYTGQEDAPRAAAA
jgi:transposase